MILTRTPFRISFVGGGTDQPSYFELLNNGGAVVSTTIDKYMYVSVKPCFDGRVRVRYSKMEDVSSVDEVEHDIVKACLKYLSIKRGIEVVTFSDIPSRGCGLGSSSALTVGLLQSLYAFKGVRIDKQRLAEEACKVETEILKSPIGYQDQFASSYGGLNLLRFQSTGVVREDLRNTASYDRLKWLEDATMLFYLGEARSTNDILSTFRSDVVANQTWLKNQSGLVPEMLDWLRNGVDDGGHEQIESLVSRSWEYKKKCSPLASTERIAELEVRLEQIRFDYRLGFKVCGAGGGGFLLVVADPSVQHFVRSKLVEGFGVTELHFKFDDEGSQIVYKD